MKRTKWLALLLTGAMTLSLTACVDEEVEDVSSDVTTDAVTAADNTTDNGDVALEDGSWAVYWYLCGSDLESNGGFATNDLSELMEVELPENVNVVIETGGASVWQNDVVDASKLQRWVYNSEGLQLIEVSELPPYDGAYVVDPLIKAPVILPTKGKNMRDNVTVKKMRQLEVGNGAGGNTLIIGEEL